MKDKSWLLELAEADQARPIRAISELARQYLSYRAVTAVYFLNLCLSGTQALGFMPSI